MSAVPPPPPTFLWEKKTPGLTHLSSAALVMWLCVLLKGLHMNHITQQDRPWSSRAGTIKIKANITEPRWTPDKKIMFMIHINVSIMQIVTLANGTILREDCPPKGWTLRCVCFLPTCLPGLTHSAKPGSLKTFQTKSFPTRNYFQLFLIY